MAELQPHAEEGLGLLPVAGRLLGDLVPQLLCHPRWADAVVTLAYSDGDSMVVVAQPAAGLCSLLVKVEGVCACEDGP